VGQGRDRCKASKRGARRATHPSAQGNPPAALSRAQCHIRICRPLERRGLPSGAASPRVGEPGPRRPPTPCRPPGPGLGRGRATGPRRTRTGGGRPGPGSTQGARAEAPHAATMGPAAGVNRRVTTGTARALWCQRQGPGFCSPSQCTTGRMPSFAPGRNLIAFLFPCAISGGPAGRCGPGPAPGSAVRDVTPISHREAKQFPACPRQRYSTRPAVRAGAAEDQDQRPGRPPARPGASRLNPGSADQLCPDRRCHRLGGSR